MTAPGAALELVAPADGWVLPLTEIPDAVFADGLLGDGVAIDPVSGLLCAPCDGLLLSVAPTRHAVTLRADNGAELLLHLGIETVGLRGEGFESLAEAGRRVRAGDPLLRFDMDAVARRATSLVSPLVLTNGDGFELFRRVVDRQVVTGEFLLALRPRALAGAAMRPAQDGPALVRRVRITLAQGLHARPAALLAHRARAFAAETRIVAQGRGASARSPVSLMSLGLRCGDAVSIEARGGDAAAALDALESLLGERTQDLDAAPAGAVGEVRRRAPPAGARLAAVTAAPGIALGAACPVARREYEVAEAGLGVDRERGELARAQSAVRSSLRARAGRASGPRAEIANAHLELLDDPALADGADERIRNGRSAGFAWRAAVRGHVETLRGLGDPLLAERADDLLDLETQVLAALAGDDPDAVRRLPDRAIVLADLLLPSQLVALDEARVAGICTARGGPTSHVAILAAAMGKPMLVGAGPELLGIEAGTPLLLDADAGALQVAPAAAEAAEAAQRLQRRAARDAAEREAARAECRTTDGERIAVLANLGAASEAAEAVALGAEGCGLLRTEFLFLGRREAPDATAQAGQYQRVADAFGARPVVIRVLDAGSDKPIPFMAQPHEGNPALGLRGIRAVLARPELLRTQLEAVLSLRPPGRCRLMLPMVQEPEEIERVRAALETLARGMGVTAPALGVMVETPSAAVIAERICEAADFVSIGTNDLTQYTLAMDRTHPDLAARLDGLHPAVLRLVGMTARAAAARGRPVAVCGGLAADAEAIPLLLGLGVRELSVAPRAIPGVKARVRGCRLSRCRELAERCLALPSAAAVRELARRGAGAE